MRARFFAVGLGLVVALVSGASALAVPASESGYGDPTPGVDDPAVAFQSSRGAQPETQALSSPSDTTWFGRYTVVGDEYFALPFAQKGDAAWTFDRGIGPVGDPSRIDGGEGWASVNLTQGEQVFGRIIDSSLNLGPGVPAPVLEGARSLWVGATAPEASGYGYQCLAGYGDKWRQEAISEPLEYGGSGEVELSLLYFQDSEPGYDGTQIYLQLQSGERLLLNQSGSSSLGFTGQIGINAQGIITPALYIRAISPLDIGPAQQIRLVIEFRSDGAYSDRDCGYQTRKGPLAVDRVRILGGGIDRLWGFEQGAEGWTFSNVPAIPDFAGIADFDCYHAEMECLSDNVLEAHDGLCDQGHHPVNQFLRLESPICDIGADWEEALLEFDVYWEERDPAGFPEVLWRVGWRYFPSPGPYGDRWSERVGSDTWLTAYGTECERGVRAGASAYVPTTARQVKAVIEIHNLPEFAAANPGPLLDNLVVAAIGARDPSGVEPAEGDAPGELSVAPNPARAGASVAYSLSQDANVQLEVLDVGGRVVRTLARGDEPAGSRSVWWDGNDRDGRPVGAGIYWVRVRANGAADSRKVVVIR